MLALAIVAEGNGACKIAYCRVCLDTFKRNEGRGRPRIVCIPCAASGKRATQKKYKHKYRPNRANKPIARQYQCKHCDTWFNPKRTDRVQFCSRACADKHRSEAMRARKANVWPKSAVFFAQCVTCSELFSAQRSGRKFCSSECSKKHSVKRAYEHAVARKGDVQITCKACGEPFKAEYGFKRRVFCSRACLLKASRRVRKPLERARLRAAKVEPVDPFKVFDRDGWRCQICHKPTPRRLRGSLNDRAPELDHIVPLAKGGEHSYRNTQCACRQCNRNKSATVYGQLVLFA